MARPDRLLAGLTGRQLTILAAAAVVLWALYVATRTLVPLPAFAALAVPLGGVAVAVAVGRVEGQPADRLLLAAFAHWRRPRRLVPAPDGLPPLPGWASPDARADSGAGPGVVPGPLRLPLAGVDPDGTIDLGSGGRALITRASSVTFALRSPAEQDGMVGAFAGWLNALSEPVQILVRSVPLDLTGMIDRLTAGAPDLPHPALETAARAHATYLAQLAGGRTLLHREVLVVFRQPTAAGGGDARGGGGLTGEVGAAGRLARRAAEAAAALAAAGVSLAVLDGPAATDCLLGAVDPVGDRPGGLAGPDQTITGILR